MGANGTILVAEDDRVQIDIFKWAFENSGYEVKAFSDGAEVIDRVHELNPDLIILDIKLPHVDGWEIAAKLKSDAVARNTPVIIVSGLSKKDNTTNALLCGCLDYLEKPCDPREIVEKAEKYIRLGRIKKKASRLYENM
jgi:DNA-binding response OmpR family regulator